MARIKVFEGGGPNPNVPFAGDIPRPQFIGQVQGAVSDLAKGLGKEAEAYMQMQKKQKDSAAIAQADAAKILFQSELDGSEDLYDSVGNIDLEKYKERINSFYDNAQTNMSSEAYQQWRNTQTVLDARRIGSLMSENMKRTREANKFNTLQSIDLIGSNSLTGSFQDMQDSSILIRRNLDDAVSSGILELPEAAKLESDSFKKLSKSYIDNLKESVSAYGTPTSQINKAYDNAMAFVDADPFGVFTKDEGLRNAIRQNIAVDRLKTVKASQENYLQTENLKFRVIDQTQKSNFERLKVEGYSNLGTQSDPNKLVKYHSEIDQLVKTNQLDEQQARYLKTLNRRTIESIDDGNLDIISTLSNDDDATKLISRITDPNKVELALRVNKLSPERKELLNNLKQINTKQSQVIIRDFADKQGIFNKIVEKETSQQYDENDLYAAFYLKHNADGLNSKKQRDFMTRYNRYVKSKFPSGGVLPGKRAKDLMIKIEEMYELEQQEKQNRGR